MTPPAHDDVDERTHAPPDRVALCELRERSPAAAALLRTAELMFIELVRHHLESMPSHRPAGGRSERSAGGPCWRCSQCTGSALDAGDAGHAVRTSRSCSPSASRTSSGNRRALLTQGACNCHAGARRPAQSRTAAAAWIRVRGSLQPCVQEVDRARAGRMASPKPGLKSRAPRLMRNKQIRVFHAARCRSDAKPSAAARRLRAAMLRWRCCSS